ncbi:MAG: BtpA/SgcQ family protein [Meiothermus sp.]|nr:BtpA/SgcQ family protein [Meiothermus sp.]
MPHPFLPLFPHPKPVVGVLHLKGDTALERLARAKEEIEVYYSGGVDAVLVEDYFGSINDAERVLQHLQEAHGGRIYGVNILDNFHRSYELAVLYGARFMQVDSVAGHLPPELDRAFAAMVAGYRALGKVSVLGGVRFKYQPVLSGRSLEEDLHLGMARCDAVVVTGEGTGMETDLEKIREFRAVLGEFPLIVGAGVTLENCGEQLALTNGAIVGSYFKDNHRDTGHVDADHVRQLMSEVSKLR